MSSESELPPPSSDGQGGFRRRFRRPFRPYRRGRREDGVGPAESNEAPAEGEAAAGAGPGAAGPQGPQVRLRRHRGEGGEHFLQSDEVPPAAADADEGEPDEGLREVKLSDFSRQGVEELLTLARQMGAPVGEDVGKQRLVAQVLEQTLQDPQVRVSATGVLERFPEGFGLLRSADFNYLAGPDDIYVSPHLIKRHNLRPGDTITGDLRAAKPQEKYFALTRLREINFLPAHFSKVRPPFDSLTPCYPTKRLTLETTQDNYAARLVDLFAPVGLGQRAMIVSPPKAGKTMLLQNIANAITTNHPNVYLIVLLIDERPEEVTDMKRNVKAEVISSTFDEPAPRHVAVSRMVIEKAKRLVERKVDVVILLDSLTRLARAYNQVEPASGKILSGGVDANALHKPKRFFGAARNVEEGGSLTIIATALIETGSKMDEVIFEEFKGTGNMELALSRRVAERRMYPAMDLPKSGTRREELLLTPVELAKTHALRNALGSSDEIESIELMLDKMKKTRSNAHFLQAMNSGS